MDRLRYLWTMVLLMAAALQAAGQSYVVDEVCVGSTRKYRVDGETNSTYQWLLYSRAGAKIPLPNESGTPFTNTLPNGTVIEGNEISIDWTKAGTYDLAVIQTSVFKCDTLEQGIVKVYDQPWAMAGNPLSICADEKITITSASAGNYSSLHWTASGDGYFLFPDSLQTVYNSGPNDRLAGSVSLTLTAMGKALNTTCTASSSTLLATFKIIPKMVVHDPPPVCAPATVDLTLAAVTQGSDPDVKQFEYYTDSLALVPLLTPKAVAKGGTYYIKGTNSTGCSVFMPVNVKFNRLIVPSFSPIDELCINSVATLQPSSLNGGIPGTWNPATISTLVEGTTRYTFTPDPGYCAKDTFLLVKVSKSITPLFDPIAVCQGEIAPALSTVSKNGIAGTWSPATISTGQTGTFPYQFTPAAGSCGVPVTLNVTITDGVSPQFSYTTLRVCQNDPTPAFPREVNGKRGTWAPAVISTNVANTFIYRFFPDAGQCLKEGTLIVTVDSKMKPRFAPMGPLCFGKDTLFLPGTSDNGIQGKWTPAYILSSKPGTYTSFFTPDAGVCADTASIKVKVYDPIRLQITHDPLTTVGGTTKVTVTASGGSGAGYSGTGVFDRGAQWQVFTVTDNAGCTGKDSIYINDPQDFDVKVNILAGILCPGGQSRIQVTASGGKGPYVYKLTGGKQPYTRVNDSTYFVGATTIPYVFEVTDASNSFARSEQITISEPPLIELTMSSTPMLCPGVANGTATVSAKYGDPASYVYLWNDPLKQTTATATGLMAGTYKVEVSDKYGCPAVSNTVVVGNPVVKTLAASGVNPLCPAGQGSILLTLTNVPDGKYDVLYNTNSRFTAVQVTGNAAIVPVPAGTYTNLRLDINGCVTATGVSVTLTDPVQQTIAEQIVHPTCAVATGSVFVTIPANGTGFVYSIDNGSYRTSGSFSGLATGTHLIKVKSPAGCETEKTITINSQPPTPAAPLATVTVQPDCNLTTGSIEVTSPLGAGYQYSVDGQAFRLNPIFTGLVPGPHTVRVRETSTQCISLPLSLTINPVPGGPAAPVARVIQPDCVVTTGTIEVTSPLGAGYQYSINGTTFQPGTRFVDLAPGNYTVFVKLISSGCISLPLTVTVNPVPANPAAPVALVKVQPDCNVTTGTIEVTAPLGAAYQYSLNGNAYQAGVLFTGLNPGNYDIRVKDKNTGCESLPFTVTVNPLPPSPPAPAAFVKVQPDCNVTTGTIEVTAPLGAGYRYSVDGLAYQSSPLFTGLAPATYGVRVKEMSTGCVSLPVNITVNPIPPNPAAPTVLVKVQPDCNITTGTLEVTTPLGTDYQYSLDGVKFQLSPVFAGLNPGNYNLWVKDMGTGCRSLPTTVKVNPIPANPVAPVAIVSAQPNCEEPTGTVKVNAPVGTQYQYRLDGGVYQLADVFKLLAPGSTHTVQVKDMSTGCESLLSTVKINAMPLNPPAPKMSIPVTPTCNNQDGTVVVTSPVGVNYEYSMDGGAYQASPTFDKIKWGSHVITVRDVITHCVSLAQTVNVPAIPPAPVLSAVAEDSKCYGDPGKITFTATNTPNGFYTVKYDGGQFANVEFKGATATTPATAIVLAPAAKYSNLTIDVKGCMSDPPIPGVEIKQPLPITVTNVVSIPITLKSPNNGSIELVGVKGGTGKFYFRWESSPDGFVWTPMPGETLPKISNLGKGSYRVTVMDDNGCKMVFGPYLIPAPNYPPVAVKDQFTSNCNVIIGNVLINDSDLENDPLAISLVPVTSPRHGSVTIQDEDGNFTYRVDPLFAGKDSFVYAHKEFPEVIATVVLTIISDMDHDGIADAKDPDADGDGILNIREVQGGESYLTADADLDGLPNYLDIDADGDGIVDFYEGQPTNKTILPSKLDVNHNGVDDAYDKFQMTAEIIPVDTDGDGIPDFLDTDSDQDGVPDFIEGNDNDSNGKPDYVKWGKDLDRDGLDDAYDITPNDCDAFTNFLGSRTPMQDFDKDGRRDWRDENDDDDKYLTKWEDLNGDKNFSNDDTDFDGYPEYLDYGRECDLFIPDAFSPNNDNIHDYYQVYCINHYPDAHIYIFDQLGNKLYEQKNYGNMEVWGSYEKAWWNGKADRGQGYARNELVPPGTYYYVLDLGNGEVKKSFVFVSY